MNPIWETIAWDIARAGGFTAYVLLTLAVLVGLALSTQLQSPSRWPRLLNSELHNFLTLLSTIFLIVHVTAVWVDPFTHFGWNEIFIPLASYYRPAWMAFGIIALYLGLAIGISTWLRPHIGYTWWRKLHIMTLGIFVLTTIHGLGTGSDTQTGWALGVYLISIILVSSLLYRRIFVLKGKGKHAPSHSITQRTSGVGYRPMDTQISPNVALISQPLIEQITETPVSAISESEAEVTIDQLLTLINQMKDVDPNDERYRDTTDASDKIPAMPIVGKKKPALSPELRATLDAYNAGLSLREVAARLGVSKDIVKWRLEKLGIRPKASQNTLGSVHFR